MVKTSLANIGINYADLPAKLVEEQLPAAFGGTLEEQTAQLKRTKNTYNLICYSLYLMSL